MSRSGRQAVGVVNISLILALILGLLAGCGQKTELYLPEEEEQSGAAAS
ncbi:MAG: LPS translocon maturation chaperone LptM [Halorhodospira sp.]